MTTAPIIHDAIERLIDRIELGANSALVMPSDWIERYFYVPAPRDPVTGRVMPPGPIRLAEHQRRIINEALSKDRDGNFKYTTVIYSAPKKSGKSTIASAVGLYVADQTPFGRIYCLANDGEQANDRLFGPILKCIQLHRQLGGKFADIKPRQYDVVLSNSATIEPVPCDALGEAGAEPTLTLWSELWGFTSEAKRRLWTEMTVPPTLFGRAMRWVETYAGFSGESLLLEQLYHTAVTEAERHPDFPDLPVYVNHDARTFCYWDTEPRMIWQNEEFYKQEARLLTPIEFQRVHRNQWVSPVGAYIASEMWSACRDDSLQPLTDKRTPVVIGIDAATEGDCAALVAVTRDPKNPSTDIAVRACRIFRPTVGKSLVLEDTVGAVLKEWCQKWNVVCVVYDAFQMMKLVQDYRRGLVVLSDSERMGLNAEQQQAKLREIQRAVGVWYYKFNQQSERAIADKMLYDMIVSRRVHWAPLSADQDIWYHEGNRETLTRHITQAGATFSKGQMRLVKTSNNTKIDAVVALSMAVKVCMELNVDNYERAGYVTHQ